MSSNQNQGEPALLLFMMLALFAGLGWLVWHATGFFWLDHFFRWLRFGEIWIINIFSPHYDACLTWLRYAQVHDTNPSAGMVTVTNQCFGPDMLSSLPPKDLPNYFMLSMPPLVALGNVTTRFIRWPLAIVMIYIACYTLFLSPRNKFSTKHTLESFIQTQAKMWPIISPIVKFNPTLKGRILGDEIPDKLPLFAEPLSPEEWVSWNRIPVVNGIPDKDATRRAFIQQLGPRWNGIETCPPHIQALFAAFAIKGAQKREESDDLLGRIALAWTPEKGLRMDADLMAHIKKILRDPEVGGKTTAVADQHAWRTTATVSLLRWARSQGGVLAPAQFLWMRAEDRALWYPLNNLGRRSFHSEGAGAMAHFMAEQAAQKPLPIPRVDTAIATLNIYLHDPERKPVPIPARESTKV
jgi:intracellular multiplication protein IcmP